MAVRFEITDQIAYIGDGSYPIAAISSLRVATKWRPVLGVCLVVVAVTLFGIASDLQAGGWAVAGIVCGVSAIGCFVPEYILFIRTAGGEASVLNSRNRKEIETMRREIEAAIIAHFSGKTDEQAQREYTARWLSARLR